jgi:hypothetical protein
MHTNRKPYLVLVAVVLCVSACPIFGQQSAKGKAAETATLQLLQIHQSYQKATTTQEHQRDCPPEPSTADSCAFAATSKTKTIQ